MTHHLSPLDLPLSQDKWALLDALRDARQHFGLKDRSLTVLRALLSCHPERELDAAQRLIVFPSNETLSKRCEGMPESTLRRHLSKLVALGLIARHDSPSRKRYAHRTAEGLFGFGFDLAPLLSRADEIACAAEDIRARRRRMALLRDQIRLALPDEAARAAHAPILRRQDNLEELETLLTTLETAPAPNPELSGDYSHFERLIPKQDSDSVKEITAEAILETYPELQDYTSPEEVQRTGLIVFIHHLSAMMGFPEALSQKLIFKLNPLPALAMLGYLLRKQKEIHSFGAYTQALLKRFDLGKLDLSTLLPSQKLTAVNFAPS